MLEKHPSIDYFIIPPAPLLEVGLTCDYPDMTTLFRTVRDRAFATGEKTAVGFMYKLLALIREWKPELVLDGLESQLGQEFGMSLEELHEQLRVANEVFRDIRSAGLLF